MARIAGAPGRKLQRQATRANGWTHGRRMTFLVALAATSNVSMAAAAVGRSPTGAYRLRRRDPVFAALWETAIEEGYRHLEGELLAQARGQTVVDDENPSVDELMAADRPRVAIDPALGVKLLELRDARVRNGMPKQARFVRRSQEDVDAALMALCRRLADAEDAGRLMLAAPRDQGESVAEKGHVPEVTR